MQQKLTTAALSLLVTAAFSTTGLAQQTTLGPAGTYLTCDPSDNPQGPTIINLAGLGYLPGQQLFLRTVGDFVWNPGQQLQGSNAVAIFSSSTTVLGTNNQNRVPGALPSGAPAYVTAPTFVTNLVTDIPNDFVVTPSGISVTIPNNGSGAAPYLLLGADDVFWSDNVDPETDFGVVLVRPTDAELLTNRGFEIGTTVGWSTSGAVSVTSYGLATTPLSSISSQIQGGNRLATGNGTLQQTFDLTGNANEIDSGTLYLELSGYFGGYIDHSYWTALEAVFENGASGSTGPNVGVGYITYQERNQVTTLMRRSGVFLIPAGTRTLKIQLRCNQYTGGHIVLADNVSAKLRASVLVVPQPIDTELLDNGNFETGQVINPALETGWSGFAGYFSLPTYGGVTTPPTSVSNAIQGGNRLITGTGNAQLRQTFDVTGNATAIDAGNLYIDLSGYFGGYVDHSYWTALEAIFENGAGGSSGATVGVGYVDYQDRNQVTTLMRRRGVFPIPAGTRTLRIQLRCNQYTGGHVVLADKVSAVLRTNNSVAALPLDSELLDNGTFENGQIINPGLETGWAVNSGGFSITTYGGSSTPVVGVSTAIQGGSRLITGTGNAYMQQAFDVSGNANAIDSGSLFIDLSGHFGGYVDHSYWAALEATFENGAGGSTGATVGVGYINYQQRNQVTTLMRRAGLFPIPSGTRLLKILLRCNQYTGGHFVFADNLSAKLRSSGTPAPLPLGAELLDNGNFETGQVINPNATTSWTGYAGTTMATVNYGAPNLPLPTVSNAIGGGAYLGRANGTCEMVQWLDLNGNAGDVDAQNLALRVSGWFGGIANNGGAASIRVEAYTQFGGLIPPTFSIGSVTPAERANVTTLLHRTGDYLLPFGTRTVAVVLRFSDGNALADNLSAQLLDVTTPLRFPGTQDGLTLLSGVNALPSGGPRADTKIALAGNVLTLRVDSPTGRYVGAPLFFAGNAFTTGGSVPPFGIPGLHVNPVLPGFFWLLDGQSPMGPFGAPIVVPGGVTFSFIVPPGLAGGSLLFQGLTLSPLSNSGVFATTDGHEIRFQ